MYTVWLTIYQATASSVCNITPRQNFFLCPCSQALTHTPFTLVYTHTRRLSPIWPWFTDEMRASGISFPTTVCRNPQWCSRLRQPHIKLHVCHFYCGRFLRARMLWCYFPFPPVLYCSLVHLLALCPESQWGSGAHSLSQTASGTLQP